MYIYIYIYISWEAQSRDVVGLFCKRALQKRPIQKNPTKETLYCIFKSDTQKITLTHYITYLEKEKEKRTAARRGDRHAGADMCVWGRTATPPSVTAATGVAVRLHAYVFVSACLSLCLLVCLFIHVNIYIYVLWLAIYLYIYLSAYLYLFVYDNYGRASAEIVPRGNYTCTMKEYWYSFFSIHERILIYIYIYIFFFFSIHERILIFCLFSSWKNIDILSFEFMKEYWYFFFSWIHERMLIFCLFRQNNNVHADSPQRCLVVRTYLLYFSCLGCLAVIYTHIHTGDGYLGFLN